MRDVRDISSDINKETHAQGEKLDRVERHMTDAAMDTDQALVEITRMDKMQRSRQKCVWTMLLASMVVMSVLFYSVYVLYEKSGEEFE